MVFVSAVFSSAAFLVFQDKPVAHRDGNLLEAHSLECEAEAFMHIM